MKKIISSALALTMLATFISSACFADEAIEPNIHYVQNENRSEPLKEKKCDSQKTRKILAGVAAGTVAIAGATVATLKHFEDKLPESLKVKFPFLFTKKAQETQENIKTEKIPETVTETVTADSNITKNETIKTVAVDSNITKNETIEPITTEPSISMNKNIETVATKSNITKNETTIETIAAELNITKKENTGSVAVNSNTTKNETADFEAIKAEFIQALAKNNPTNDANDTNWLSTIGNVLNSAQAKYVIALIGCAALTPLVFLGGYKARKVINNFLAERKAAARAMKAAPALNALKEQFTPIAAEAATKAAAAEAAAVEAAAVARATEAVSALKALKEQFTPIAAEAAAKAAAAKAAAAKAAAAEAAAVEAAAVARATEAVSALKALKEQFTPIAAEAAAKATNAVVDAAANAAATVTVDAAANAAATVAVDAAAKAAATVVNSLSHNGEILLEKMSDGNYRLFGQTIKPCAMRHILSANSKEGLHGIINNMASRVVSKSKINNLVTIIFPKIVKGNFEASLRNIFPQL